MLDYLTGWSDTYGLLELVDFIHHILQLWRRGTPEGPSFQKFTYAVRQKVGEWK